MPSKPSNTVEKFGDDPFPELTAVGDPALRLVAWCIQNGNFRQLEQRTGVKRPDPKQPKRDMSVPVLLQIKPQQIAPLLYKEYAVPAAYGDAIKRQEDVSYVTARLPLEDTAFDRSKDTRRKAIEMLRQRVDDLRANGVVRVCVGAPGHPSRHRSSLEDIGLPAHRTYKSEVLTGEDVIVGIIDDGCALAHPNFLKPTLPGAAIESRILYLWDQAREAGGPGWNPVPVFGGMELDQAAIDAALNAHKTGDRVNEDAVYKHLSYKIEEIATHGTHVMDIAAGGGRSLMGIPGVAPKSDIIFVQLPRYAIQEGATVLWSHVQAAVRYIFEKAGSTPAVINISYGGYDGPHDGTSELERALDEFLTEPNRAIVMAGGNGFEARCHAVKLVKAGQEESLHWILNPEDPTPNELDAWYELKDPVNDEVWVRVQSPGPAIDPAGWIKLGQHSREIKSNNKVIGHIEHLPSTTGNGANRILISLNATDREANVGENAQAPSGTWIVTFSNQGKADVDVHAWIWRDDSGEPRNARRRQSRFHPDDAEPTSTVSGWGTGEIVITAGAYNVATQEICGYSACGPTRPIGNKKGRPKPEIYAPAEEDVRGRGVLSASALSANPTRMNGTSAAAPHVAGLIALMFEFAKKQKPPKPLTADEIRKALIAASKKGLKLNRHQKVDHRVKKKQQDVEAHLRSSEKADFWETMKRLFP